MMVDRLCPIAWAGALASPIECDPPALACAKSGCAWYLERAERCGAIMADFEELTVARADTTWEPAANPKPIGELEVKITGDTSELDAALDRLEQRLFDLNLDRCIDRLEASMREWACLPWYRRLWYWIFGAPEIEP